MNFKKSRALALLLSGLCARQVHAGLRDMVSTITHGVTDAVDTTTGAVTGAVGEIPLLEKPAEVTQKVVEGTTDTTDKAVDTLMGQREKKAEKIISPADEEITVIKTEEEMPGKEIIYEEDRGEDDDKDGQSANIGFDAYADEGE